MWMVDWFQQHEQWLGWLGAISVFTFFGTLAAVPFFLIRLPANYLCKDAVSPVASWPLPLRWGYRLGKNLIGGVLLLAGIAMLVLPGQGLLTIFVALLLSDLPGKRRLLRRLIGQQAVMARVNRWREKAGRPPLQPP